MSSLKYAVHAYAWTGRWSNATLDLIDRAKRLGFDVIEIPLMDIEDVDPRAIRPRLQKAGIGVYTSTACPETADITADDSGTRARGLEYLKRCVKVSAELGAKVFSGVIYSALGRRIAGPPDDRYWNRAAEALKEVAQLARQFDMTIGIEPVNRYETFLVNTCDQAVRLRSLIGEPNVAVHLDAYHMNIEENNFYEPTIKAAPFLCHYHLSESHRGIPGTGTVDWEGIYRALAEAGYSGVVGLESFVEVAPAMQGATCIWRLMAPSSDVLLSDGLKYLKSLEAKHYGG